MATADKLEDEANSEDQIVEKWKEEQLQLKKKLIPSTKAEWINSSDECVKFDHLKLVGGVDISFKKGNENHACACLVVLSFPDLEVVYQDLQTVHLTAPYVPEFLAFREVEFLVDLIDRLKEKTPQNMPQVIMVDGNGVLHPRGFGVACHLGVLTDIPTIGVAKKLFCVDGIEKSPDYITEMKTSLKKGGDVFSLVGNSGVLWGKALRSTDSAPNPIFVSVGHRIGLECAVQLVHRCCSHRVPEPTRQADMISRKYIRENYEKEIETCPCQVKVKEINELPGPSANTDVATYTAAANTDVATYTTAADTDVATYTAAANTDAAVEIDSELMDSVKDKMKSLDVA